MTEQATVSRIGRVPRAPVIDLVGDPFDQSEIRLWTPPYVPLAHAIRDYAREHAAPAGIDIHRIKGMAWDLIAHFDPQCDIAKIDRQATRTYANHRMTVGAIQGATARKELSFLRAVLGHAEREARLVKVPKFYMPAANPPKTRYLTREEHRRLMTTPMPRRVWLFYLLAFNTGARAGAIESLTWDRVDLARRTIDYRLPGVNHKGKRRVVAPINDKLMPRLEGAYRHPLRDEYVIGAGGSTVHACKAVLVSAGLNEPGICRHVARHTFASWLLQSEVPIYEVAKLLGDTVAMVERVYGHVAPEHLMRSANRI